MRRRCSFLAGTATSRLSPCEAGNPVISMWQFTDTIYYGWDLAD
jgi:hypothetical protein